MTKKFLALAVLGLVGTGAVIYATGVSAYRGDPSQKGPNYTPERHAQMLKAFESKDYNAWKGLMNGKGRVTEVINEGNFNRFAEMRKLMLEGKTDEANKIRQELGLGQGNRMGQRGQNRSGNFVDANKDGVCDRMQ